MTINLTNSNDTQINTFNPNFNQNIESVCINIDTVVHTEYEAILANSPNENITHDQQITEGYILNKIKMFYQIIGPILMDSHTMK